MVEKAVTRQGFTQIGASDATGTTGGVATLITPAANVRGCWLRTFNLIHTNGAAFASLYADTAAPASSTDATKRRLGMVFNSIPFDLQEIFVPAGQGVYVAASAAGAHYSMTYDLL